MAFDLLGNTHDLNSVINDMNRVVIDLQTEQRTKTFKDAEKNNAIVFGKLPNGKYGLLIYEGTTARVLIGQSPDDTYGIWVSKEGEDVLEAF